MAGIFLEGEGDGGDRIAKLEADMSIAVAALSKIANDPYRYGQRIRTFKKVAETALTRIQGEYSRETGDE